MKNELFQKLNKNNRGSTLILVIVCMFFVSIIGMMILSITMINVDMKKVERKSTENFYGTEAVMEELNTELRQGMIDAYKAAYVKMLQNYVATSDEAKRQEKFFRDVLTEWGITLAEGTMNASGLTSDKIKNLIELLDLGAANGTLSYDESGLGIEADVANSKIIIHGVTLEYWDDASTGYKTKITTDLALTVLYPDISLGYSTTVEGLYDSEYVIIANGDIKTQSAVDTAALGSTLNLTGNVYAGKNIKVFNSPLNLSASKFVAGSTLLLENSAILSANMKPGDNNGIWARNIELAGGSITLDGNCYVADDLTLNKEGSTFVMANGQYYGYTFTNDAQTDPKFSSAVVINKPNITVDFSGCTKLWISGNAYINETNAFGTNTQGILEGEAVAYKNMQAAYLIPGACVMGVGHNPILNVDRFQMSEGTTLENEFIVMPNMSTAQRTTKRTCQDKNGTHYPSGTVLADYTILPVGEELPFDVDVPVVDMLNNKDSSGNYFTEDGYYIDVTKNKSGGGIMLERYVDLADSYTQRSVSSAGMTYYYLLFKNAKSAAQYYQEYAETTRGQATLNQINNLKASTIKFPADSSAISTMGNLISYNGVDNYSLISGSMSNAMVLLPVRNSLTQKFNALLMRLNPLDSAMVSGITVVDAIAEDAYFTDRVNMFDVLINQEQLKTDYESKNPHLQALANAEGITFYMCAAWDRDVKLSELNYDGGGTPAEIRNTVIITNKSVIIDRDFGGLIIAGEDVVIATSGADDIKTDAIKLNDLVKDEAVGKYFKAFQGESRPAGNQLPMDNVIHVNYENWQKN